MQYFNKLLLCLVLSAFCGKQAFSQNLILSENFDSYTGADSTAPANWYISKHGVYTTGTSSGINPNAFKFSADSVVLVTPYFSGADSLSFWVKGFSTTGSSLYIYESVDSLSWDSLSVIDPLPTQTAQGSKHFAVKNTSHYLMFLYRKVAGNLSFDDFELWENTTLSAGSPEEVIDYQIRTLSPDIYMFELPECTVLQGLWMYDISGRPIALLPGAGANGKMDLSAQVMGVYIVEALVNGRSVQFKLLKR